MVLPKKKSLPPIPKIAPVKLEPEIKTNKEDLYEKKKLAKPVIQHSIADLNAMTDIGPKAIIPKV